MSDDDEICRICGEPRSAHVETWRGPFTHPKEASGEGRYRLAETGTIGGGLWRDDEPYERYEFVPSRRADNYHPTGDGSGALPKERKATP